MAEGEGTSFENPWFDPDEWDGDDDDDESGGGDETTPFIPNSASTPGPSGEEIPRQREKSGLPETSYAETPFTGAQSPSEQAWDAAKDLFPDMSSSELEVSYSSKGKLQVKMFGAGKKTYDLFTKDKRTGMDRINPNLSKEIKTALGAPKVDQNQQELQKNRKELNEKQYEASPKEKHKKEMDEIRETVRKKQQQKEDLENAGASQEEIDKAESEIRSLETEHQKARSKYEGSVQAAKDTSILEEDIQVLEDSQAVDLAGKEKEIAREALKATDKRLEAIDRRWKFEFNNLLENEASDVTPERKQEAQKKMSELDQERKRLVKDKKKCSKQHLVWKVKPRKEN